MSINPESVQQLLSSRDFGDRLQAVNQLRQLEPALAFDLIQSAIVDKNVRVRYAAVSQLGTLGEQNLSKALLVLRESLKDSEPDVQSAAADALGALKLTAAFDDLQELYHRTPEWLVQLSIIAALGEMGEPQAFDLLQSALNSDNELIQTIAIGALGELGDRRAIGGIMSFADNADWQVRYRVAQALGRLGGSEVEATLSILAGDEIEQVAETARAAQKIA